MKFTWEWIQSVFNFNFYNHEYENKHTFDAQINNKNQDVNFEKILSHSEIVYW